MSPDVFTRDEEEQQVEEVKTEPADVKSYGLRKRPQRRKKKETTLEKTCRDGYVVFALESE